MMEEQIQGGSSYWWPTNGVGDATTHYTADDWALFWKSVLTTQPDTQGVVFAYAGQLAPSVNGSNVTIASGAAVVNGKVYFNTSQAQMSIPSSSSTRYDRIVLRLHTGSATVRIWRVPGTDGGSVPALPQNSGSQWVIPLATLMIVGSTLTLLSDDRQFCFFTTRPAMADNQTVEHELLRVKDLGISAGKIADGAVTGAKLANLAVSAGKIADGAVTGAKLANLAVSADKIADGAVTGAKLGAGAVTCASTQRIRIMQGTVSVPASGSVSVTYAVAFASEPTIFTNRSDLVNIVSQTQLGFVVAGTGSAYVLNYIAVGAV